ncbi:hypothetical protein L211DRAFT_895080, partial [Terfezia boudieri ATCC MYA-4762]
SLHPYFITGFSDAESSFCIKVVKDRRSKLGYSAKLVFQIGLHKKDLALLNMIRAYFGDASPGVNYMK